LFSFVDVVVVVEGVVVVAVAEGVAAVAEGLVVVPEAVPVVVFDVAEADLFEECWRRCGCSCSGSSSRSFEPSSASS